MQRTTRSGLVIGVLFGLVGCSDAGPEFGDGSFTSLTMKKESDQIYCTQVGDIHSLTIKKEGDSFMVSGVSLLLNSAKAAPCTEDCTIEHSFGPSPVLEEQITKLQDKIAAVPAKVCDDDGSECRSGCTILVTIDAHTADKVCCGDLDPAYKSAFDELLTAIHQTAPAL